MKECVTSWLEQLPLEEGIQAYAVRLPDAQTLTRVLTQRITDEQVEAMWHPLFETVKAFNVRRLPVGRLFCKFEHHAVLLSLRPDGLIFGILTTRHTAESRRLALQGMMGQFLSLEVPRAA